MDARIAELVANPALTPDALRLILYVASLGDGEHEIRQDTLQMLFRCRSAEPIYRARDCAETHGLGWKRGGKGHATIYFWNPHTPESKFDSGLEQNQKDFDSSPQGNQNVWFRPRAESKPPVVEGDEVKKVKVMEPRAREESFPLSEKASAVLEANDDGFSGFRGSLRDYLEARVPTARQYGYVQTLVAWLSGRDGNVFMQNDGSRLPDEKIPGLIATAFNELLATDEGKMARPIGDPANLKTKLGVLCRPHKRRDNGSTPTTSNGTPLSEAQFAVWMQLREDAERRGMSSEKAAESTYEEARRSA